MTTNARDAILANIRKGIARADPPAALKGDPAARLAGHPRNVVPARAAALDPAGRVELFVAMATEASAVVSRVPERAAVPAAVAAFLEAQALPPSVVLAPELAGLDWTGLATEIRPARGGDPASVTPAFAGIAETGTLVLHSGGHSPTSLNFVPDHHLVVLEAARIVGAYEDAWDLLRAELGAIPRTVNLITGPSRTADLEQTLLMGAHGPVQLCIVLVG